MKSFKIVFASLLIAAMGVVGFSSFTTAHKKAVDEKSYVLNGATWDEQSVAGCTGEDEICGLTFDDGNGLTIEQIQEDGLPSVQDILNDPTVFYGETEVHFYLRDTPPAK